MVDADNEYTDAAKGEIPSENDKVVAHKTYADVPEGKISSEVERFATDEQRATMKQDVSTIGSIDYYSVLGVNRHSTPEQVLEVYNNHPNKTEGTPQEIGDVKKAKDIFMDSQRAFNYGVHFLNAQQADEPAAKETANPIPEPTQPISAENGDSLNTKLEPTPPISPKINRAQELDGAAAETANAVAVVAYVPSAAPTPKPTSNTTPGNNPTPMTPIGNSAPTPIKDDVKKDAKKDDANKDIANNSKPADERKTDKDDKGGNHYLELYRKSCKDMHEIFGDSNLRKGLTDPAGSVKAALNFGGNALSNTYSSVKNKVKEIEKNYSNAAQAIGNGFTYLANKNDKADTSKENKREDDSMNKP